VEVWGSSPHGPTIYFNYLRISGSRFADRFNTEFNMNQLTCGPAIPFVGSVPTTTGGSPSSALRFASMRIWL
jgi:hypothetical protein